MAVWGCNEILYGYIYFKIEFLHRLTLATSVKTDEHTDTLTINLKQERI